MAVGNDVELVAHDEIDQLRNASAVLSQRHEVGRFFDGRMRIRHGHGALAAMEKGVVVFRVADPYDFVFGERHSFERGAQAGALIDPRRQHHHRALIEDDVHLEAEIADAFEDLGFLGAPSGYDSVACFDGLDSTAT